MGLFTKKSKTDAEVDLRDEEVIDLTQSPPKVEWGFPTRCPECAEYGYLDRIDVVHEVMYQHCPSCWARWETPRSATSDVNAS